MVERRAEGTIRWVADEDLREREEVEMCNKVRQVRRNQDMNTFESEEEYFEGNSGI